MAQQAAEVEADAARAEVDPQVAAAEAADEAHRVTARPEIVDRRRAEREERREQRRRDNAAKTAARRDRHEASRAEKQREKAARAAAADSARVDPLVPPPPSLDGRGGGPGDGSGDGGSSRSARLATIAVVLGALGLLLSVILAVGALVIAVEIDASSGPVGFVSDLCDVLVGPLGGLFQFSGSDAASRSDLVARGVASMVYLAIGLGLASLARRGDE